MDWLRVPRLNHRAGLLWATGALGIWASASPAAALKVDVVDRDGKPVNDVVVVASLQAASGSLAPVQPSSHAIMDQVNRQFVPRILVIRTGTPVDFPNSDTVAHQVYSFSPAKRFQLSLYKGHVYPPLVFDQPGLIVLGCNIHDNMLGYIYVTPSPYFGKTSADGSVQLEGLPGGDYAVSAWSPRFNETTDEITRELRLAGDSRQPVTLRLSKPLSPEPRVRPAKANRSDY
jgi:plastocyanin